MKKSVYSLVLMDDIIRAVDEEAYRLGTSRSNLINQILAEHLSCITPEMRMNEIFSSIAGMINSDFQIQQRRSDSLMTLRTALEYKYRPTINYKVELARSPDNYLGSLKVQIRTQSMQFISLFNNFFAGWINMEKNSLSQLGRDDYCCGLDSGRFTRKLLYSEALSDEETGEAIYSYIALLDKAVKLYFSNPQDFPAAAPQIEREYNRLMEHTII